MKPLYESSFSVQRAVKILFIVVLAGLMLTYAYYQARNLINGPSIELSSEPSTLQHERTITLAGHTKNITALSINGNPVYTDEKGDFSRRLVLENGYTIMTIEARDRYGRETSLTRSFVYIGEQS